MELGNVKLYNLINRSFNVVLKPLTPLHSWSGSKLIVGFDVVRRGNRVCIVDLDHLPPRILEGLSKLRAEDIPKFIEENAHAIPCRLVVGFGESIRAPPPNKCEISDLNSYILPGSSLKGYIRTALLYVLMRKVKETSVEELRSILRKGVDLSKGPKEASVGLEASFFRTPRLRRQGGYVDSFQQLCVSDPGLNVGEQCYSLENFTIYELRGKKIEPVGNLYAIAVRCGELKYKVDVLDQPVPNAGNIHQLFREHRDILDKLSLMKKLDIIEVLRVYGCENLDFEIERVKGVPELAYYSSFLEEWKKKYCESGGSCVIARLGLMTGRRFKTVINLVQQVDPRLYQEITSLMSQQYGHAWDDLTLKLVETSRGLIGVGWCELCVE